MSNESEPDVESPPEITGLGVCVLEFRREVSSDELVDAARDVVPEIVVQKQKDNWTRVALGDRMMWLDFRRMAKRGTPFYVRCEIINRFNLSEPDKPIVELARRIIARLIELEIVLIDFELGATAGLGDDT